MSALARFAGGIGSDVAWRYWRPFGGDVVELGIVRGREVSLPPHFHEEDQLTFVLSGRRRFVMNDALFDVTPGEGVEIPAGTPHRSLSEPAEVVCVNIYASPGAFAAARLFSELSLSWRRRGDVDWPNLAAIIEGCRRDVGAPPERTEARNICWETVGQAARLAGMSREGFSRRFRKLHGMPPQMFRLSTKLNEARRLLRAGEPLAAAAAEAGFADQSHLGRCFLRAFGVAPGRYRRSVSQSESGLTLLDGPRIVGVNL